MGNNLIISNDSYKLIATGTLITLLAFNNINSTYVFKSSTDMYKEELNMNYLSKSELKSNMNNNLLIKNYNSSFPIKNNVLDLVGNDQELSVDNIFKRKRVKIMVKNRCKYVPFFDFEEVYEEL